MFRQLIALVVITLTAATTYAQQQTHNFFSIEKALKSPEHVFYLDLSNQGLTSLPAELSSLENLISLNLAGNDIKFLPSEMTALRNLTYVDLSGNRSIETDRTIKHLALHANIEELNLSNCNIMYLPASVGGLKKIISLDVSNNQLVHLPNELDQLTALESMNVSDNALQSLGWYASHWLKLKELNLSGNEELDYSDALASLALIELEHLTVGDLNRVPKRVRELRIRKLTIEKMTGSRLQASIAEIESLEEITISDCKSLNTEQVVDVLSKVPQLKVIFLVENGLTDIDKFSRLDNLQYLSLQEKHIDDKELDKLERKLSGCIIDYDPANLISAHQTAIDPPLKTVLVENSAFQVDASTASQLQYEKTTIDIPANAFLDANSEVVNGNVDVTYREFNNPVEIMLSGIPMTYDSAGTTYQFASAGMVELQASQNGTEVFANPEAPIKVNMASDQTTDDFNVYGFDEQSGSWDYQGRDSFVAAVAMPVVASNEIFFNPARIATPPRLYIQKVGFKTKKHIKTKGFTMAMSNYYVMFRKANRVTFPEYRELRGKTWVYDGEHADRDRAFLDSMSRHIKSSYRNGRTKRGGRLIYSRETPELITDIGLSVNPDEDNYLLKFELLDTTIHIPVYASINAKRAETEQRKNRVMQENYSRHVKRRKKMWGKKKAKYDTELAEYEQQMRMQEIANRQRQLAAEQAQIQARANLANAEYQQSQLSASSIVNNLTGRRTFRLLRFGVTNCDRVIPVYLGTAPLARVLAANLTDEQLNPINSDAVFVMDFTFNTNFTTKKADKIRYYRKSDSALIVRLSGNRIGYLNTREFDGATRKKSGADLPVHVIDLDGMTADDLQRLLSK
jgi:Leucine-rich repeat (LRR) protein